MEENNLKQQSLVEKRNALKTRMDLREVFIWANKEIINQSLKSIKENRKELKQFEDEYLKLLDEL